MLSLKNKTENGNLKLSIENLKCIPDADLNEKWKKLGDSEKANAAALGEDDTQNTDYEYYDESQLGGKLFYIDIRDLINCTSKLTFISYPKSTTTSTFQTTLQMISTSRPTMLAQTTSKMAPSSIIYTSTTPKVYNHGILDLSEQEKSRETTTSVKPDIKERQSSGKRSQVTNEIRESEKPNHFTTSRLATVSAKPSPDKDDVKDMASDQAVPPNAHRRAQELGAPEFKGSNANINSAYLGLVIPVLIVNFRL